MKYLYLKDKRRRLLYSGLERRKLFLRALIRNTRVAPKLRTQASKKLISLPKDSSITRIRNRCVFTNRPRAVYRKFGLSRLMFRKYVWKGKLAGVKNSSW